MGSFYSNIHLHTTDRARVESSWGNFWAEREGQSWAMVSPPYGGWVSLFDWHCDQIHPDVLQELAGRLSADAECVALAFQVQDSLLAEYWLYQNGREADAYSSNVEYFPSFAPQTPVVENEGTFDGFGPDIHDARPGEEDVTDGGNTGLLRRLTHARVTDIELDAILRSPAAFAEDILTSLASAIGINDTWAAVGYHYLVTENDLIPGFAEFHHLPAGAPYNLEGLPDH